MSVESTTFKLNEKLKPFPPESQYKSLDGIIEFPDELLPKLFDALKLTIKIIPSDEEIGQAKDDYKHKYWDAVRVFGEMIDPNFNKEDLSKNSEQTFRRITRFYTMIHKLSSNQLSLGLEEFGRRNPSISKLL